MTLFARLSRIGCLLCCCSCLVVLTASAQSVTTMMRTSSSRGLTSSKSVSVHFGVGSRQSVSVSGEYVRDTSFPDVFTQVLKGKQTWKLKAVPLTVGYSRYLADPDQRVVPILRGGLSYYFTRMKALDPTEGPAGLVYSRAATEVKRSFEKRYGMGFGAEAALGLRASLTRQTFVLAEGRGRFVHGLAFTHEGGEDLNSRFAQVDFSVGVGFKF